MVLVFSYDSRYRIAFGLYVRYKNSQSVVHSCSHHSQFSIILSPFKRKSPLQFQMLEKPVEYCPRTFLKARVSNLIKRNVCVRAYLRACNSARLLPSPPATPPPLSLCLHACKRAITRALSKDSVCMRVCFANFQSTLTSTLLLKQHVRRNDCILSTVNHCNLPHLFISLIFIREIASFLLPQYRFCNSQTRHQCLCQRCIRIDLATATQDIIC